MTGSAEPTDPIVSDEGSSNAPPQSFVDYAVDGVRRELVSGSLKPGERVAADSLARRLAISHIPVREALRYLEAEGHLVRDRRRLVVAAISAREAEDIYRTRELLEEELTALGVPELTAEDKQRLTELTRQMEAAAAADDQATYHSLTRQFHFLAFERANRPWVVRFLRILWDASARYQRALFEGGSWRHAHVGHHRDLLDALVGGDVERVNQIMRRHRQWLIDRTR